MTKKRGLATGFGGLVAAIGPQSGELLEVPIGAIEPNPHQPRTSFEPAALHELAESIRQHGLLQPLIATRSDNGDYRLIAGERRLRAARLAGLHTVSVVLKEATEQQQLELALIENLQRADLDPIEAAHAYAVLEDQFGLTHERIAERVGKSRSTVSETLGLLKLPREVQELVSAGSLSAGHAAKLVALRDARAAITVAHAVVAQGLSVRAAERYIDGLRAVPGVKLARSKGSPKRAKLEGPQALPDRPGDEAVVKQLEERLGVRVQMHRSGQGGRLVFHFDDEEMLSGLYDWLVRD